MNDGESLDSASHTVLFSFYVHATERCVLQLRLKVWQTVLLKVPLVSLATDVDVVHMGAAVAASNKGECQVDGWKLETEWVKHQHRLAPRTVSALQRNEAQTWGSVWISVRISFIGCATGVETATKQK